MDIKVLVLDIDGTLVNNKKEITKEVKKAIVDVQKKGVKVVIASGRATYGVMPIAKELEFDKYGGYVLSYNGGRIVNCKTNEVVYEKILSPKYFSEIYEQSKKNGHQLITYDEAVLTENENDKYVKIEADLLKMKTKQVDNLLENINVPVNKMLMVGDPNKLAELEPKMQQLFEGELNVFRSEPFFLEFMPLGIDKAKSLERLISILNVDRKDLMAIGDGFNDLSMIEFAGVGVAMENAQQVVKDAADYITLSNEQNGVAYAIENWVM